MTGTLVHAPTRETIEFDTDHANGNGPLDPAIAEARFNELISDGGMLVFAEMRSGGTEQVRRFDPQTQERVTMTPQMAGGR